MKLSVEERSSIKAELDLVLSNMLSFEVLMDDAVLLPNVDILKCKISNDLKHAESMFEGSTRCTVVELRKALDQLEVDTNELFKLAKLRPDIKKYFSC